MTPPPDHTPPTTAEPRSPAQLQPTQLQPPQNSVISTEATAPPSRSGETCISSAAPEHSTQQPPAQLQPPQSSVISTEATASPSRSGETCISSAEPEHSTQQPPAQLRPPQNSVISTEATAPPSRSGETCISSAEPEHSTQQASASQPEDSGNSHSATPDPLPYQRHRPPLAPGLYLVSTPIGNLEDISLRALRVLAEADRIACEDTRQTQKLLNHFGLRTPTISYHRHNERERAAELLTDLKSGARIAVVSDAGTPGLADPGAILAQAAAQASIPVFPVPGASALLAAISASGLDADTFHFHGFLPAKSGERRSALEALRRSVDLLTTAGLTPPATMHAFYEAPHRILDTLADLEAVFGPAQPIVLARELTKLHEEFLRGPIANLRALLTAREIIRGEFVLLLPTTPLPAINEPAPTQTMAQAIRALIAAGTPEKDALKQVARDRNLGKSDVYREWQRHRNR